LIAFSLVILLK